MGVIKNAKIIVHLIAKALRHHFKDYLRFSIFLAFLAFKMAECAWFSDGNSLIQHTHVFPGAIFSCVCRAHSLDVFSFRRGAVGASFCQEDSARGVEIGKRFAACVNISKLHPPHAFPLDSLEFFLSARISPHSRDQPELTHANHNPKKATFPPKIK